MPETNVPYRFAVVTWEDGAPQVWTYFYNKKYALEWAKQHERWELYAANGYAVIELIEGSEEK